MYRGKGGGKGIRYVYAKIPVFFLGQVLSMMYK